MFSVSSEDTRTSLNGTSVTFSKGEAISIYDGTSNRKYTADGSGSSVTFSGSVSATATEFYVLTPYSSSTTFRKSGATVTATTNLPSTQEATSGSFASGTNIAAAKTGSAGNFTFQNMMSLAKLTLKSSNLDGHKITSIKMTAATPLAGDVKITFGETCSASAGSSTVNSVILTHSNGSAFSDGTYIVVFEDYRYIRYTQLWQLIAAVLAFWPLLTVALYWIRLLSKYISSLSLAARRINNGDLYSEVSVPPHASEEILSLAESMDEMRTTFLDRLNEEKQRSHSNQELLTVMSHDIRTPLTTLIGYAEIMDKSPDLPEDERKQYSSIIYQRALRLKELTDEMFYYFLVYGSSDIQVDLAYYNAQVLIPQLINDRLSAFQDLDVEFQIQVIEYPFTVHTDISLLNRVFDNIFSKIRKDGDLTCPITIEMRRKEDNFIHIEIRNRIRDTNPDVESTHIGTKTCSKLMELLDGFFTFHSDEEFYTAEVLIPISYNRPADKL